MKCWGDNKVAAASCIRSCHSLSLKFRHMVNQNDTTFQTSECCVINKSTSIELSLACIELVVAALLSEELVVGAAFDYLAVFEYHDGVGITNC